MKNKIRDIIVLICYIFMASIILIVGLSNAAQGNIPYAAIYGVCSSIFFLTAGVLIERIWG